MKLLSYGLDHRQEPRLAFSLNGYAVDVMRASLWMKNERQAQDFLTLPSSMRLTLEDWPRSKALLEQLQNIFQGLDLSGLRTHDRVVAMPETDIAFFAPEPHPPALRLFEAFDPNNSKVFSFGNTQTLLGHRQFSTVQGLIARPEMGAIIARSRTGQPPEIAGYCVVNNWVDPQANKNDSGARFGTATSLGPYMVTADELESQKAGLGWHLSGQLRVDGQNRADTRFKEMHISFSDMLHLSSRTNIQAGDVFCSGTPFSGSVSAEPEAQIDIEIQGLGVLSTPPKPPEEQSHF